MTFKELSEGKERNGARLFSKGDVVYIHPEISVSTRYPSVVWQMTELAGFRCIVRSKEDSVYNLLYDDNDPDKKAAWRKFSGDQYFWTDWMLLGENELSPNVSKQDFLNML